MAASQFIWNYAVWVSAPVFCLGLAGLVWCIWTLVRVERTSLLARLPLTARQTVVFNEPGRVVLCVEGPLPTFRFWGLSYRLLTENDVPVPGRWLFFRTTSSGFTTVRSAERLFKVRQPGNHTLLVDGLDTSKAGDGKHFVVFKRPVMIWAVPCILGMILCAGLAIGSLVLFILKLAGVQ